MSYSVANLLESLFRREKSLLLEKQIEDEKKHRIALFDTLERYAVVQNKTVNYPEVEITTYSIEHIFCDYQTFTASISEIKERLPNIESIKRDKNEIDIKFVDLDKITIILDPYSISINLYDILRLTPLKEVEIIMSIFKDKIDALIDQREF